MKAIKIVNSLPLFSDCAEPQGSGVLVRVVSSSICGTDLHLLPTGMLEGLIPGHECAGYTPDGKAVAIEPFHSCGSCLACADGLIAHCQAQDLPTVSGLTRDGGMAESVLVPEASLVELPTGLDVRIANLVETLAVCVRGFSRCRLNSKDKVLVIGAGSIGLGSAACLQARGMDFAVKARYPHQQAAAEQLGASLNVGDGYDLVVDAVANEKSMEEAVNCAKPDGRILLLGNFWEATPIVPELCQKELTVITSIAYKCTQPNRSFVEAASILFEHPHIADAMITHRFPLDGAAEAFATAADKSSGAIKVTFDVAPARRSVRC
ncbi:MAG: alcohol dehydrogenase catalytic domain-containing protein [Gammaproteobacteria bacterium]|nr:alcohol dehydrogenase catalytic domain-containing protein [Gammaproteobacteria bacterium]MYG13152.1 alcohol dehydrogenase catalytic domain-containing protein [Gammaproteobacteria bacterium]MYK29532.1 alcohol dehydrogenase catalytic domain-containing protein [Gammaproteobacteria bacterium]